MIQRSDMVVEVFMEETAERLDSIESGLLRLEQCDGVCDLDTINSIFRDAHSVKAGSNLLKLKNIEELAHKLENVLEMIRKGKLLPNEMLTTASLEAIDKLRELLANIEDSDKHSIRLHSHMLQVALEKSIEEQS